MANEDHLAILKQGVEAWNKWRQENSEIFADLSGADLSRSDFYGAKFRSANLSNTNLTRAELGDTDMSFANLIGASLIGASLIGADLTGTRLDHADFHGASLGHVNFNHANLSDANLSNVILINSNLSNVILSGTNLSLAEINVTTFGNNDLSTVIGLDSARVLGPCTIGIDTLYKSKGQIPVSFLRGCGVPEDFITYSHSLGGKAIDFYSCFISFTEANDEISKRLHNDLRAAGVRCWRWKEDAKWGKTLMRSIDEAVLVYDKLVVICSEQSLNAPAVIREIERALQKEDELARQGKESEVLFPIRIDDYIFTGWSHYRKPDVLAKNVGDFRNWHEPANYQSMFDRLLKDLKAEGSN